MRVVVSERWVRKHGRAYWVDVTPVSATGAWIVPSPGDEREIQRRAATHSRAEAIASARELGGRAVRLVRYEERPDESIPARVLTPDELRVALDIEEGKGGVWSAFIVRAMGDEGLLEIPLGAGMWDARLTDRGRECMLWSRSKGVQPEPADEAPAPPTATEPERLDALPVSRL